MSSSTIIAICAVALLVLLFLKVPVYIAVLGASACYFVLNPSANPVILHSRRLPAWRASRCWQFRSLSARVLS